MHVVCLRPPNALSGMTCSPSETLWPILCKPSSSCADEKLDISLQPLLKVLFKLQELQSMALSDEGSKAELLKRLESHRPSLWERLKELP